MKIFVNSLPKSGTNLVEKLVRLLGFERSGRSIASSNIIGRHQLIKSLLHQDHFSGNSVPVGLEVPVSVSKKWLKRALSIPDGEYLSGHAAYSEQLDWMVKEAGVKVLQVYRDPRAVIVSWANYAAELDSSWYPFHELFERMNLEERIEFLIKGGEFEKYYHCSFSQILKKSHEWQESSNVLPVYFEELVGSAGGGSDEIQLANLERILEFLGADSGVDVEALAGKLYGGTHTFREGSIQSWREKVSIETSAKLTEMFGEGRLFDV